MIIVKQFKRLNANQKVINKNRLLENRMEAKELLETPEDALNRVANGGKKPKHYVPTPAINKKLDTKKAEKVGIWDQK